jgi:hypothetical protein
MIEKLSPRAVVPKARSVNPKGSATTSQGICEHISVMATLKFDVLQKIITELLYW